MSKIKKEKLWKSELLRSRNANYRQRSTFLSRATVFAGPITPNVNEPLANFFRHRLVSDVFLAKRCAWHAASDILLAFVFGLFFLKLIRMTN